MNQECCELKIVDWNFPILIGEKYFNADLYRELKKNFPDMNEHNWSGYGQMHRKNIRITSVDDIKKEGIHESYIKLFEHFDSIEFKNKIFCHFNEYLDDNGFIGDIDTADFELFICEAEDGYDNPFHVDTRSRIVHMLFYFGMDDIIEGGELAVAKHRVLDNSSDYPQYPELSELTEIKKFKPIDNLFLGILSTPNSYHKGCPTKGIRRFLYIAYNNKNGSAWKHDESWNIRRSFHEVLEAQK